MSGTIFMFSETSEDLENKWNPLQCHVCHEQYHEPCILQCYHSFCTGCLSSKIEDGKVICPLCGVDTVIKEDCPGAPPDALLKFLVETSAGDKSSCANCDEVQSQMYFCNTCSQSLCNVCREETHQAKMFQSHEVVLQTKHTRDIQKQCNIHKEPYILFSTEKKVMLCINCFRDMKVESRSHCVDLETAYKQGCQKLDDTMQSIRDLQSSVRDSILLLRALLEEIESNVEKEKKSIQELYDTMQEKITEMRETLLTEIDRQYEDKVEMFKKQLVSLTTFLPTLHVHLVTCAAFSSSANKYEFLDFTYVLMKRLMSIIQVQHPLHPSDTSDIVTEYKTKFARCLEPLLFPHRNGVPVSLPSTIVPSVACTRYDVSPCINSPAVSSANNGQALQGSQGQVNSKNMKKYKLKLIETKGFFSDHCKEFDTTHREFMQKVDGLKLSVQELQRDITLRRSLTKEASMNELTGNIDETDKLLDIHQGNVEDKRTGLEKHWEESVDRIAAEQEVYQAQLQDVGRLKSEVASVKVILQKLTSFMTSIASVTQRLAPKLRTAAMTSEQDSTHAAILQEINTMQPDSQQRVDAISRAQEVRDIRSANRVNPLDEELVKTKGLLRSPSLRKESTIKRLSAEIKDAKADAENKEETETKETESKTKETETKETESKETESKTKETENTDKVNVEVTDTESNEMTVTTSKVEIEKESNAVEGVSHKAVNRLSAEIEVDQTENTDNSSVECKNVLSAYEIHRHLEPSYTQSSNCNGSTETDTDSDELVVIETELGEHEELVDKVSETTSSDEHSNKDKNESDLIDGEKTEAADDEDCSTVGDFDIDIPGIESCEFEAQAILHSSSVDDLNVEPDSELQNNLSKVANESESQSKLQSSSIDNLNVEPKFELQCDSSNVANESESQYKLHSTAVDDLNVESNSELHSDLSNVANGKDADTHILNGSPKSTSDTKELTAEFNVEVLVDEMVLNESDLNTSTESGLSGDDSVKPGLVKDLVAIVDGLTKAGPGDMKLTAGSVSPKPKSAESQNEENGDITSDSNKSNDSFDIRDLVLNESSDTDLESVKDIRNTEGSPQSKSLSDNLSRSPSDQASVDEDEIYVAKSLPELAQVFEPGELKQKRKRNKSAKSKNTSD